MLDVMDVWLELWVQYRKENLHSHDSFDFGHDRLWFESLS